MSLFSRMLLVVLAAAAPIANKAWTATSRTAIGAARVRCWPQVRSHRTTTASWSTTTTARRMAIDYNDPVVAEEFAKVQPMPFEDVEEELLEKGIPVSASISDMDARLMLVEMRLRMTGKVGSKGPKKRPAKFSSKFEEAMWTKPAFADFYNELKRKGDHNAQNVVTEYLTNRQVATQRYGKDYRALLRQCEEALNAAPPVKTTTIQFSGFPANMGEAACRMTLESIGPLTQFECQQDEDFPILRGKVTFENIDAAKKAVAQYNGMNMGMGTVLEMVSV